MKKYILLLMGSLMFSATHVIAAEDWIVDTQLQSLYGKYQDSSQRDAMMSGGFSLAAEYHDQAGFLLGATATRIDFKESDAISQQSYLGGLHYNIFSDTLSGKLGLRVDAHWINNNDPTGDTDRVRVLAPLISYVNFKKTFYLDLGFAYSRYQNDLSVIQVSPALGFALNSGADWLQLRGYWIEPSDASRAQSKANTTAVDAKYTHWFSPGGWYIPDQLLLSVLAGERIYAVDHDAMAVYNLADTQQGSYALGLQWQLGESGKVLLMGGSERYLNAPLDESYQSHFAYLSISTEW
ncbi:MAG: hypothetical protein R8M38_04260 [Mariprofundaceae bacterium]